MKNLLTAMEVAEYLGVTKRTVMTYKKKGILPYYQVGRVLRFRREDVYNHIENNLMFNSNEVVDHE